MSADECRKEVDSRSSASVRGSSKLTAFFIQPAGALKEKILRLKSAVGKACPGLTYCNHPPHCTVYCAPLRFDGFQPDILADTGPFKIQTTGWHVFRNDVLAGGGDTLVLKIKASAALFRLQLRLADLAEPYLNSAEARRIYAGANSGPCASSVKQYGFPFVGRHWIPHFTIASFRGPGSAEMMARIIRSRADYSFQLKSVALLNVKGETHVMTGEYPLSKSVKHIGLR